MKQNMVALIAGVLFGFGLALSQLIDPARVLGFLDVAGTWDPTLIFVLGGAVGVTMIAFRFVLRQPAPFFALKFSLPMKAYIDRPLIIGSALFGIGWGIAGYCPGPGITSLVLGSWNPVLFVIALVVGSFLYNRPYTDLTSTSEVKTSGSRGDKQIDMKSNRISNRAFKGPQPSGTGAGTSTTMRVAS